MKPFLITISIMIVFGCGRSVSDLGNIEIQSEALIVLIEEFIADLPEMTHSLEDKNLTIGLSTSGLDTPIVSIRNCLPFQCNLVKGFTYLEDYKAYFQGANDTLEGLIHLSKEFECGPKDFFNGRAHDASVPPVGIQCPERSYYFFQGQFIPI